ncbi:MAG TPA: hypothetical protein VMS71_08100 [Candidatus Acidoferrum sp.]|nr:hypothetical protein [Candidatus Acidoferrum sp.]
MGDDDTSTSSGEQSTFLDDIETREVVLARGIDYHESDVKARNAAKEQAASDLDNDPSDDDAKVIVDNLNANMGYSIKPPKGTAAKKNLARLLRKSIEPELHAYLKDKLGSDYNVISDDESEYTNLDQRVHFHLKMVTSKPDFITALETSGIMVIYGGHSRYGRGACFDVYSGRATMQGEQWEGGNDTDDGLFRMAYPIVPVGIEDLDHHQYTFYPVAVEDGVPAMSDRHPDARRQLKKMTLTPDQSGLVAPYFESATGEYYGCSIGGEAHILVYANWADTYNTPQDIGAVDLQCKAFCHFGCSSRLHYWEILRKDDYKAWQRDKPPTDKFAYFTTQPSQGDAELIWLHRWFSYNKQNNNESWWNSLEYAKRTANTDLTLRHAGYQIF